MKIGIDMQGVQTPGKAADFCRELVGQLLARPSEHHWALLFHGSLGGMDAAWPGRPDLRQLTTASGVRNLSDGLLDAAADCDLLLLTGSLRASETYLPPPRLARGPRMAALVTEMTGEHCAEPRLTAPARSNTFGWKLSRLRQYDLILTTSEKARTYAISALEIGSDTVVNLPGEPCKAAEQILTTLADLQNRPERGGLHRRRHTRRERIAFFSPLPPARSGIADYSARLLETLERHYAIDLFHDPGYLPQLGLKGRNFPCFDYRLFRKFQRIVDYAGIVYQMGNSGFHGFIYDTLLEFPGLVVLHDFYLSDLHYWYSIQPGIDPDFMAREMERESPSLAAEYRLKKGEWAAEPGGIIEACHRRGLTFNRRVLERAMGLVQHDAWGAQRLREIQLGTVPASFVIPQGAAVLHTPDAEKAEIRRKHGLANEDLIVGCFGIVHSIKYPLEILEAFHALAKDRPSARLLFVGRDVTGGVAQAKANDLGLADRVQFLGHVSTEAFLDLAAVTDIGVNLRRPPTRGETSAALMTLLGCGVSCIVTDVDAFSVFPGTVVEKIGPLSEGAPSLFEALQKLADQPEYRRELGAAAIRYIDQVHNWPRIARLYVAAIESLRSGEWRFPDETGEASDDLVQPIRAA